jgi:hypothetical protein
MFSTNKKVLYHLFQDSFDYIQDDYVENGIHFYIVKMRDASIEILTTQLSSSIIDKYTKLKNRNDGPSQGI